MIPLELIVTKVIIIPTIIKEVHPTILNTTIIKMVPIKYNHIRTMVIILDPFSIIILTNNNMHLVIKELQGNNIALSMQLNEDLRKK